MRKVSVIDAVDLKTIPERQQRILEDFNSKTDRYWKNEGECRMLIATSLAAKPEGLARQLIKDRFNALAAEKSYRMTPRSAGYHAAQRNPHAREHILAKVLAGTFWP